MNNPNTVILCSGSGSNMESIAKACISSELGLNLLSVITNNSLAHAIVRANNLGIKAEILPKNPELRDQALEEILFRDQIDLILLAGYLKKIPSKILSAYKGRILNIHPSLLPKYGGAGMYGIRVHQAVCDAGETETGATVHIVTGEYDKGPIVLQEKVSIERTDTAQQIADKVLKIEHSLYLKAIKIFLNELSKS